MQIPGPHLTWQSAGIHIFSKCRLRQWCACPCWEKFWAQSFHSLPLRNVLGFREPRGAHVVGASMTPRTAQWAPHQGTLHRVSSGSLLERHPDGRGPLSFSEGSVPAGCLSALRVQPLPRPGPGRGTTCSCEVLWGRWARSSGSEQLPPPPKSLSRPLPALVHGLVCSCASGIQALRGQGLGRVLTAAFLPRAHPQTREKAGCSLGGQGGIRTQASLCSGLLFPPGRQERVGSRNSQ